MLADREKGRPLDVLLIRHDGSEEIRRAVKDGTLRIYPLVKGTGPVFHRTPEEVERNGDHFVVFRER